MGIKLPIIIILALLFLPVYFVFAQTPQICGELEYSTLREGSFSCEKVDTDSHGVEIVNVIDSRASACPLGVRKVTIVNKKLIPECNNVSQVCGDSEYYGGFIEEQVQCISRSFKSHYGKSCKKNQILRGINEDSSLHCVTISTEISCPEGQYLTRTEERNGLYIIRETSGRNNKENPSLYEVNTEATGDLTTKIGETFHDMENSPQSVASHNGKLYMIGDDSDSLYILDPKATGRSPARIIGETFSDQERFPTSIASHNGKLYMIGRRHNTLYVLDTEAVGRSPATTVGGSFGNLEGRPQSIASHNGKLYMIGFDSTSLYELNPTATEDEPTATIVGGSFGDQEDSPRSITSHNGELYMIGEGSNSLYVLDTEATGKSPATKIGESFGDQEDGPQSIASHNGKLYMIGGDTESLYVLDTEATGDPATIVGESFSDMENDKLISITSHVTTEAVCQALF